MEFVYTRRQRVYKYGLRIVLLKFVFGSHFGNMSLAAGMILIIFCMQLLFRMRRGDIEFRFGPKAMKGFLSGVQNYHCLYLPFDYF